MRMLDLMRVDETRDTNMLDRGGAHVVDSADLMHLRQRAMHEEQYIHLQRAHTGITPNPNLTPRNLYKSISWLCLSSPA